jgi:hypothetical protein
MILLSLAMVDNKLVLKVTGGLFAVFVVAEIVGALVSAEICYFCYHYCANALLPVA